MECYLQNLSFQIVLQMTATRCTFFFFRFKGFVLCFGFFLVSCRNYSPPKYSVTSTSSSTENMQTVQSYETLDFDDISVTTEYFHVTII